jgi:isoquinoline 1-oxidoreductase beta subunit
MELQINRRTFLKGTVLGLTGLTLGFRLEPWDSDSSDPVSSRDVTIWLNISEDNQITIVVVKAEMGQGVATALPMIVAEELEADWQNIKIELKANIEPYSFGGMPLTAGSTSVMTQFKPLREVGATAKEMLITACAGRWNVEPDSLTAENSRVTHPDKGSITYGELAEDASKLSVPKNPKLKDPKDFKIIGQSLPRLDTPDHLEGKSVFGIDVVVPDMLYAAVRQSPVFGGEVSTDIDSLRKAAKDTGAEDVAAIPGGVAVVAKSWWEARKAAESLDIEFSDPEDMKDLSSDDISEQLSKYLMTRGERARHSGLPRLAMKMASVKVDATYEAPYSAHACMEPMTCTAMVTSESCEIWVSTQGAQIVQWAAAEATGLDPSAIKVYPTYLGGGFGRKGETDYVVHAILASRAVDKPVKVIWSREEDIQHDSYRPVFKAEFSGGIDKDNRIVSWIAKNAGPSVFGTLNRDFAALAGFSDIAYSIPNISARSVTTPDFGVPVGAWRSPGSNQNRFFTESFMDELAHAAGADPLQFRKDHLQGRTRGLAVLDEVEKISGWGNPGVPGAAHGVAYHEAHGSFFAIVAEVTVENGVVKVHKVFCAADCGIVVNPDILKAQIEGGFIFGMSAAMDGDITIENGRVKQSNFHDFPLVTLKEAPDVETSIISSSLSPGGVGELSVPPAAPVITNAIYAATGERIRKLPISRHEFS